MISGENVDVDPYTYMNTMTEFRTKDDVFTYLIHLGYLAYDRMEKNCRIPNKEVLEEWQRAVSIVDEYLPNFSHIETGKMLDSKM